jgi:purine-binding chemotaxis protein CheW
MSKTVEASTRVQSATLQLVGFRLDGEDYAVEIMKVQEIILVKPITRLPRVHESIEGVINLRGSVIAVVNLRRRYGLASKELDDETRIIVVNIHGKTVGCIVDEVTQVMRIAADQIRPVPSSVTSIARQQIMGLAKLEERLLIVVDIEKLFDADEIGMASV